MKKVFLFLVLMSSTSLAQDDSLKDKLNFYPLQTGNYWEYRVWQVDWSTFSWDSSAYSINVIGDTVLANGRRYKILHRKWIYPESYGANDIFERIDSVRGSLYLRDNGISSDTLEAPMDSLFAQPGDTMASSWIGITRDRTICDSIMTDSVLGIETQIRYAHNWIPPWGGGYIGVDYGLAKGLGLFVEEEGGDFFNSTANLIYARINGIKYGTKIIVDVKEKPPTPAEFDLSQNYPNPFNPTTVISYQLPAVSQVSLKVYDVLVREVATLVNEKQTAGIHSVNFDASKLSSGVYFYRLSAGTSIATKKMLLLK